MASYFVDLSHCFNHILFENASIENNPDLNNKAVYGLPHFINIHVVDKKKDVVNVFGEKFCCASQKDIYDNVMCDGQIIMVDDHSVSSVMFLGFCEMGTVRDTVKLHTDDNSVIQVSLILKTFHSDKFKGIDDEGENVQCKLAYYLQGDDGQKHGVYFWKVNLKKAVNIRSIELPINCTMHLMAITLK